VPLLNIVEFKQHLRQRTGPSKRPNIEGLLGVWLKWRAAILDYNHTGNFTTIILFCVWDYLLRLPTEITYGSADSAMLPS